MAVKLYITLFLSLLFAVSFLASPVLGMYHLEYTIEVYTDGSATWTIEHRFLESEDEELFRQLSNPIYFSNTFVKNVKSLVNQTKEYTGRENMSVTNFAMVVNVTGSYRIVKYQFYWTEFAKTEDVYIRIGDVFMVEGLFLYGEGRVNMVYPSSYIVENVSPRPHIRYGQTLTWYGIQDFKAGEPKLVLREKTAPKIIESIKENALVIVGLVALVGVGSISFYYFKIRKRRIQKIISTQPPLAPSVLRIEEDDEKIVNLLKVAGGSLYQSTIAEQCGFSRSKTSKLLKDMENKGIIRREEKGREKIVTLIRLIKNDRKTFKNKEQKRRYYN